MPATVLGTHGSGIHSARPAGNAVPDGSLYSCSTHLLIYVSSYGGNSWSTWASLTGSGMANPMTTTGDIIYSSDNSGTPARLAIGAAGSHLTGGTTPSWTGPMATGRVHSTGGNVTTASTSFTDLTGATVTLTTGARPCVVEFMLAGFSNTTGATTYFDIAVDGTLQGGSQGLAQFTQTTANVDEHTIPLVYLTAALSAASHTIKVQWKVTAGTTTIRGSSTVPLHFGVVEQWTA